MSINNWIQNKSNTEIGFFIFILFFAVSILIVFSSPNLLSNNDPLHLTEHARSIASGEPMPTPVYSTLQNTHPNPWYGIQLYLVPFIELAEYIDGTDTTVIASTKIALALLISAFFTFLYFIYKEYIATLITNRDNKQNIQISSVLLTILTFSVSISFSFRLFLMRPHLLAIPIILTVVLFMVQKRWWALFFISAIFPFLYSASFLILIPLVVFTLLKIFLHRYGSNQDHIFTALLSGLGGLSFGVTLHPDTVGYLYNGYLVHLSSIFARFISDIPVGAELFTPSLATTEWIWILPLVVAISVYILTTHHRNQQLNTLQFNKVFILALSAVYLLLFVFVSRAIEYALPFGLLTLGIVFLDDVMPTCRRIMNIPKSLDEKFPGIARVIRNIKRDFTKEDILFLKNALLGIILVLFVTNAFNIGLQQKNANSPHLYQPAAEYIKENSAENSLVFHSDWSDYSQLVFYNDRNSYIMGMDPLFTYWYDKKKYWLWHHLSYSKYVCEKPTCTTADHQDPYNVLSDNFKARFIFTKSDTPGAKTQENNLHQKVHDDPRFRKRLSYSMDGETIYLYEIQHQPKEE